MVGLIPLLKNQKSGEVKDAVSKCKKAGIRTVMITGDHKITATAIAKQLGILEDGDEAITGLELEQMSDEELEKEINNQKNKLERIKKAYINGVFELKEYNEEKKIVEKAITELETKLDTTDSVEELRFTPKDILLKRDIDFTNKIKLEKEYINFDMDN